MAADPFTSNSPAPKTSTVATATPPKRKGPSAGQVLVVTSVMFTFISYWRTAAIVLCDLASTAYYIGGIVESQIGAAAPWFILGVMLFSYAVRSIYIESCAMFVRGGVYRIVKEAMGGGLARLAVSALLFDYILTGPCSSVTAGQYIIGLINDVLELGQKSVLLDHKNALSAAIAILVTVYFWRVNTKGIHESSDRALKIMMATTVMGIVMIIWCLVTIAVQPEKRGLPSAVPDLSKKVDSAGKPLLDPFGKQVDPLGFIGETSLGHSLRPGNHQGSWWSLIGMIGLVLSFGHSILAMSGEETLAQVYREVESPKLTNFKRAALVVFLYSLLFTSLISFFAVMIIPDDVRMSRYSGNLIGGLAMNVIGPQWAKLILNGVVVVVGFLILSGAVNTAIVGSNGVLNRVSEDGVLPDWFLKPHPRFGTSSRLINLVVIMQVVTILCSQGDVLALGEAYAFGVVWSFVFMSLSMLILRFKRPEAREYEVPLNIRFGRFDFPVGMTLIFLTLAVAAIGNLLTKEVATITGVAFTAGFFAVFWVCEQAHRRRIKDPSQSHEHLEQFNQQQSEQLTVESLNLTKPFRKLVAIRSPFNLAMLERCLAETDPETTEVVVMTASVLPAGSADLNPTITVHDRQLLTAVVNLAEHAGKPVKPVIVPTNEPFFAMTRTAKTVGAQELIMGQSNKFRPEDQLDQVALYWLNVCGTKPEPLSIRVLAKDRDVRLDIAGGSQIPKIGVMPAETAHLLSELRKSWHGVERLLLAYDGSPLSADFLDTVVSFLDPAIAVTLLDVAEDASPGNGDHNTIEEAKLVVERGAERARALGRDVEWRVARGEAGPEIVRLAIEGKFDAIFMSLRGVYRRGDTTAFASNTRYVLEHAPCRVILGFAPKSIPASPPEAKGGA
jgi:amino acid transporter/nucleotide-binding universal stress UspA family protein